MFVVIAVIVVIVVIFFIVVIVTVVSFVFDVLLSIVLMLCGVLGHACPMCCCVSF